MDTKKSLILNLPLLLAGFWMLSCNAAPNGFNAPEGSSVAVTGPTTRAIDTATTVNVHVNVTVPVGIDPIFPGSTGPDPTSGPGNNIYVVTTCDKCDLMDWAGNDGRATFDHSKLQTVSNPYNFATDARGGYDMAVRLAAPADLGVDSYTATFNAIIGGGQEAALSIAVSKLSTTTGGGTTTLSTAQ
ncbi:MAG: hypothetical protein V1495_10230 [Pseudomonadota bacterium]